MICPRDGALMAEDIDFARQAFIEGVNVRRFVGICGHSIYDPPMVEGRGWTPRPVGERRCDKCGNTMPGIQRLAHGVGPRRCAACTGCTGTCIICGQPTPTRKRKTCSDECMHLEAVEHGKRALAKLHERRAS